ncbi:MAG TPA: hypothetical protein VFK50_04975 [Sphingomicrobium sp.]|nr:hypothetical protein [Sphingomicrobium sp.]
MQHLLLGGALALVAAWPSLAAKPGCAMSPVDRAWVDSSFAAWRQVSTAQLKLAEHRPPAIVFFGASCRFQRAAFSGPWKAELHSGKIRLPDGNLAPAQVTSFAGKDEKSQTDFFVMALPSVWQAANIPIAADPRGLTAVFLHEFSHTRQVEPLKSVFAAAEAVRKMPDDFNDDSLQKHFQGDPAYVAVVEKEVDLLYRAAADPEDAAARKLAAEALALIEARQKRWFVGTDSYWKNYDDLFLTMEGFGQWVAYAWLADTKGGGMEAAAARDKMKGTRWWTQTEGLALFLVIDRFVPDWPQRAFAKKPALGIDLLRLAVGRA